MDFKNFCIDHHLGSVIHVSKLSGGLMHKMFKVETDKGTYAIKVLNPEVISRTDAYHNFIISEKISNLAKEHGIPVSSALLLEGDYLTKYDDKYYMVFDFVHGKTLSDEEITIEHCKKIGNILSQLHGLSSENLELENKRVNYKRLYDWESYTMNSNFPNMIYREEYLKNYKKYNSLLKRANERFNESNLETSICHNDMDPKNVMWEGENPIIIDWESAGLSNPYRELLEDALCWSGFQNENFNEEKFSAVIAEYTKKKPLPEEMYTTICGNLVGRFGWLKYNLERSLGICSHDLEERTLAENEVAKTIDEINRYVELIGKMYKIASQFIKEEHHDYNDAIDRLIEKNELLKGKKCEPVLVGFTNTIYSVDDYIVKICTKENNESNFRNEVDFYKKNSGNPHIPKLYFSDLTKEVIPYYYEILERVEGPTLYEIWYKLSSTERNDIIRMIVEIMKSFHQAKVDDFDFKKYIQDRISSILKDANIDEEIFIDLLHKCDVYFEENKLGLLHRDFHFDNFIYHNGKLVVLDFERSMVGAIDYDFRIFSRYEETPWRWASTTTDMLTVESDYLDFMEMFMNHYEELSMIPYLAQRLKVYLIIDLLNNYRKYGESSRLEEAREKVQELLEM